MPNSPEQRVTLEDLIKFKRHEAPDAAFWDRFDRDFENRRLRSLIDDGGAEASSSGRSWWRQAFWMFGALATAAAFAFVGLSRPAHPAAASSAERATQPGVSVAVAAAPKTGLENADSGYAFDAPAQFASGHLVSEARFVIDAIPSHSEPSHFERVLANPAFIQSSAAGAEFVADQLMATGGMRASLLVDRPRGQF